MSNLGIGEDELSDMDNHNNGKNTSDIVLYIILGVTAVIAIIIGLKTGIKMKTIFYLIVTLELGVYFVGNQILNHNSSNNVDGMVSNHNEINETEEIINTKEHDKMCREYAEMAVQRLIKETEIPYFKITLQDEKTGLFDSKVGGMPYLPREFEIPLDSNRNQMKLLAQINCQELVGLEDYPHEGILQFWLTTKWDWEETKTIYHKEIDDTITERDVFYRIAECNEENGQAFPVEGEYKINFELSRESMSRDDYRLKALFCQYYSEISGENISDPEDASSEEVYNVYELECLERKGAEGMGHKVGGYHYTTQYAPDRCDTYQNKTIDIHSDDAEVLLFQLDSDYAFVNFETRKHDWIKVMWGDAGVGRFYIKRSDLKECAFENVWYSWDCS